MSLKDVLNQPIGGKKENKKGPSAPKVRKAGRGQKLHAKNLPVKRSINLAAVGEKPIQMKLAIPAIVLIVVGAVLLSKFFVVDRLLDMSRAQGEVNAVQSQLDQGYARLAESGDLADEFAHYTYSAMTDEELGRTDRVDVLNLIQRVVLPRAAVSTWTVHENVLTLGLSQSSLQQINLLAQQLREDPLVDFCTVTTASAAGVSSDPDQARQNGPGEVTGQLLVYLKSEPEEQEAAGAETAAGTARADGEGGSGQ